MDRKAYLLSSLKKQVLQLKTQLDLIQKTKTDDKFCHRTITESSRFNSNVYDSAYRDRGVKKFPAKDNCRNLAEIIKEKSTVEKQPSLSPFRKKQYEKTRENFSTVQNTKLDQLRTLSPNPLTGEGYSQRRKGIKAIFPKYDSQNQNKKQTQRRHFSFHFY